MKQNILEKYDRSFEYSGVVMSLLVAFQYIMLWVSPEKYSLERVESFVILMGFEFIMVHSGVFMSVMPKKWSLFFFIPIYSVFAFLFNTMVADNSILILYFAVVFNRMRFAFSDVSKNIKERNSFFSVLSAIIYFVLLIVLVVGLRNYIPALGLNETFLVESGYRAKNEKSGAIFTDIPQTAICFGAVYYISIAFIQYKLVPKRKLQDEK